MTSIQVYGTDWCRLTFGVREYLINSRVDYDYFDVERDPAADEFVRTANDGWQRLPMVVVEEQSVTNPTLTELDALLRDHRVEPRSGPGPRRQEFDDL